MMGIHNKTTIIMTLSIPDLSGAPRMTLEYAKRLNNSNFKVVMICSDSQSESWGNIFSLIEGVGIPIIKTDCFSGAPKWRKVRHLANQFKHLKASLVISCQRKEAVVVALSSKLAGIPTIHFAQNIRKFEGNRFASLVKSMVYWASLKFTGSGIIANSDGVLRQHERWLGRSNRKLALIGNGIDVTVFRPHSLEVRERIRKSFDFDCNHFVIVVLARITAQKGLDLALKAFDSVKKDIDIKRQNKVSLFIAGSSATSKLDREYWETLVDLQAAMGICGVHWVGEVEDVSSLLCMADIMLHTSIWEGGCPPLAVQEAMAMQVPVIFSDCAGVPNGFENGVHGIVFPSGDQSACAESIMSLLLSEKKKRNEIGVKGRGFVVNNLNVDRQAELFELRILDYLK